ncbi:MAG: hypothetical protein ACTSU5_06820 [Promethearchaeota archaeon]
MINEARGNRDVEIDPKWSYRQVLEAILQAYGIKPEERPKKVYIEQGEEIRDLTRDVPSKVPGKKSTMDEQFNYSKRIDTDKPIEVHFKKIPLFFQLEIHSLRGNRELRKHLHLEPSITIEELRDEVRKTFGIVDGLQINFVHQGAQCDKDCTNPPLEELDIDPRHIIDVRVEILKNPEETLRN